jgi:hypothetical protein
MFPAPATTSPRPPIAETITSRPRIICSSQTVQASLHISILVSSRFFT